MIKKITSKKEISKSYIEFLKNIKSKIKKAQVKAAFAVNTELIQLYWEIGKDIVEKQKQEGWKSQVIENLCIDIQNDFPGIEGFSRTNIFRMKAFYEAYARIPQAVGLLNELPIAHIPWGQNVLLIEKVKKTEERLWYANQVLKDSLSRSALEDLIISKAYKRHGKSITNFSKKLPSPHSDLAQETLKDPYHLDFLSLTIGYKEKELERGLIEHIQKFILELGKGFAFIGSQYALEIAGDTYYLDLLFYHTKLHCYCVIELKNTDFKPEYAGKMNYYISAVDRILKKNIDNPTIGIILCKTKNNLKVEYALQDVEKPIGVSEYLVKITEKVPKELKSSLPTIEDLETELADKKYSKKEIRKKPKKLKK